MRDKVYQAIIDEAKDSPYQTSGYKLKMLSNIALFIWLGEVCVTYIPAFYFYRIAPIIYNYIDNFIWVYELDYSWVMVVDSLGLAVLNTFIWVIPYRILPFLSPLKTVPYLYFLSIGTVAILFIERNALEPINFNWEVGMQISNLALSYILPAVLFHRFFRGRKNTAT